MSSLNKCTLIAAEIKPTRATRSNSHRWSRRSKSASTPYRSGRWRTLQSLVLCLAGILTACRHPRRGHRSATAWATLSVCDPAARGQRPKPGKRPRRKPPGTPNGTSTLPANGDERRDDQYYACQAYSRLTIIPLYFLSAPVALHPDSEQRVVDRAEALSQNLVW